MMNTVLRFDRFYLHFFFVGEGRPARDAEGNPTSCVTLQLFASVGALVFGLLTFTTHGIAGSIGMTSLVLPFRMMASNSTGGMS